MEVRQTTLIISTSTKKDKYNDSNAQRRSAGASW